MKMHELELIPMHVMFVTERNDSATVLQPADICNMLIIHLYAWLQKQYYLHACSIMELCAVHVHNCT